MENWQILVCQFVVVSFALRMWHRRGVRGENQWVAFVVIFLLSATGSFFGYGYGDFLPGAAAFGTIVTGVLGWSLPEIFRESSRQVGRGINRGTQAVGNMIGTILPWMLGFLAFVFLAKNQPQVCSQLIAIAIMIYGIRFMLKKVKPAKKK